MLVIFIGRIFLKLFTMAIIMAEDKLRFNDMNTILYEMDASKP